MIVGILLICAFGTPVRAEAPVLTLREAAERVPPDYTPKHNGETVQISGIGPAALLQQAADKGVTSGKTFEADPATSLMEAGEQAGVRMPFGCRMGICQSCVVGLLDGHVRDLRTGVEHEPGSRIQTCISAASGDCMLDA